MKILITFLCLALYLVLAGCETPLGRIYGGGTIGNSGPRGAGIGINLDLSKNSQNHGLYFTEKEKGLIRNYYRRIRQANKTQSESRNSQQQGQDKDIRIIRIGEVVTGVQLTPLPAGLEIQLHELPEGYARVVIGTDIVLVNRPNRVVMDILADVVM